MSNEDNQPVLKYIVTVSTVDGKYFNEKCISASYIQLIPCFKTSLTEIVNYFIFGRPYRFCLVGKYLYSSFIS